MFYQIFELCMQLTKLLTTLAKQLGIFLTTEVPIIDATILEVILGTGFPIYVSITLIKWAGNAIPG